MTNITKFEKKSAARKHSIIKATADLIIENGLNNLTHREIAAKAKVPLGSTTQHFSSLDDLKAQALTYLADMLDDILQEIDVELARNSSPAKLAQLLYEYLQDTVRIHADVAFFVASTDDPSLRPLATRWFDGLVAVLSKHTDKEAAQAIAVFSDGALVYTILHNEPFSEAMMTNIFANLMKSGGKES